jgi:PAS domain S-box-containing protein
MAVEQENSSVERSVVPGGSPAPRSASSSWGSGFEPLVDEARSDASVGGVRDVGRLSLAGRLGAGVRSLTGRVVVLGVAVFAVVLAVLAALLLSINQVDRAGIARTSADNVLQVSDRALQAMLDMETGLRGYGLTHDTQFLAPWYQGITAFHIELPILKRLTAQNAGARSADSAVVAEIGRQGLAYISGYGDPIVRNWVGGERVNASLVDGKRRMDALRGLFDRLAVITDGRAARSLASATAAIGRTRELALAGLSGVLLLIVLAGVYLVRRVSRPIRRISTAASALSAGELAARAPEQGPGEVRGLARSFNSMAVSIETGITTMRSQNHSLSDARDEAERSAQELDAQQELAVDLIATTGFDGYFKRLNPAWQRTLGWSQTELCARPFIEFVHPEDRDRTVAEAARLSEQGLDTINFINRYRTADGSYRWLDWNVRPVAEQKLLYAVARDVTDRVMADEAIRVARDDAQRANLAKSEFLSRMSHELRTPLNAILGFGQLLEMDGPQGRNGESVAQILGAGRHLLLLIDEVLDISRIEAGTMRMSVEPVDVVSALGDVVALIAPIAVERGVEVFTEPGAVGDCYVQADRQRLRQVLLNLLSNAVKYNRPGGSVHVAFACDEHQVKITVRDTGHGIPDEKLARLFVAFDRLDAERGDVEGTGLGLALSKSLVEQMGGAVHVHSTVGEGSVFTVQLKTAPNPVDEDRLASAYSEGEQSASIGSGTILHIEDNPANARLVHQALAGQPDVRLMLAMQGSAGLDLARAHRPDLILLDLHLPDMGGTAVLKALQADADTSDIPVVVMSADATPSQIRALLATGARAYLTKPLDVREFLAVVGEHLNRAESPR